MSGPSTRSHRSSVRGTETTLTELSGLLKANKSVVIITGAGLSVASGMYDMHEMSYNDGLLYSRFALSLLHLELMPMLVYCTCIPDFGFLRTLEFGRSSQAVL